MKLPKNPTEAQILAVTGLVIKSIYTRGTVAVQSVEREAPGRLTGIFLGDGVRFRYTIDNGILSYAPVNPKDLPSEEGISLSEDALEFARLKMAGNTKQEKKCKVGYACGYSCISQNRNCRKALPGQAKTGAEWVEMQRAKSQPVTGYKGLIQRAEQRFAEELKAIDDAVAEVDQLVQPLQEERESLFKEYENSGTELEPFFALTRMLTQEEEQLFLPLMERRENIWEKVLDVDMEIMSLRTDKNRSVIAKVENLRQKLLTTSSRESQMQLEVTASFNAKNVRIGSEEDLKPYSRSFYEGELRKLFAIVDNQVNELDEVDIFADKLGKPISRAFANERRFLVVNGQMQFEPGQINVGQHSSPDDHTRALWHEFGHHLEFSKLAYRDAATEWRQSRASSTKPSQIPGQPPGEVGLPGRYVNPYVGKVYTTGWTEVISMGLEKFSNPRMLADFYRQDKEHFLLILGMLR